MDLTIEDRKIIDKVFEKKKQNFIKHVTNVECISGDTFDGQAYGNDDDDLDEDLLGIFKKEV